MDEILGKKAFTLLRYAKYFLPNSPSVFKPPSSKTRVPTTINTVHKLASKI